MLIVGELINSSRKAVQPLVKEKKAAEIQELAEKQVLAGAHYVDVNCGTQVFDEVETMEWLVRTIQEVSAAPLCIDSPSVNALRAGLEVAKANGKKQMVNSITAEKHRFESVLPLVLEYEAKVVALCMDDKGMPESARDRMAVADKLVSDLTSAGVPEDDIYLDPLVQPISTGDKFGLDVLQTISYIRTTYPSVHTICGLSNVSFGLPKRKVLNRIFLVQTMTMGMDAYILDPLDREIWEMVYASRALLGQDEYCTQYLDAYRRGVVA